MTTLTGKTILITGGTRGVGAATALALARLSPRKIYITGRPSSSAAADAFISRIRSEADSQSDPQICKNITFLPTDNASLASVSATASKLLETQDKIDLLICNAGIAAAPLGVSEDGYEIQFATNFLGHALLIRKLLPLLRNSQAQDAGAGPGGPGGHGSARIINLGSYSYRVAGTVSLERVSGDGLKKDKDDWLGLEKWRRYTESKLAVTLYTAQLAKRYPDITSVTVTPGFVESDMVRGFSFVEYWVTKLGCGLIPGQRGLVSVEQGAENSVWAATVGNGGLESGGMYDPVGKRVPEGEMSAAGKDEVLGGRVWEWTEGELGKWL